MSKDLNFILKGFVGKFTDPQFFEDIVNISLYPSDFGVVIGDSQGNSVSEYLNKFFTDLKQNVDRLSFDNKKVIETNLATAKTLLKLRDAGRGLVTYDTVFHHMNASNIAVKKLIQTAINNKLTDQNQFRLKIDELIKKIDYFYDINHAVGGMVKIDQFSDALNSPDTSIIEAVSLYKEMALQTYNDLSQLQSIAKDEKQSDYYEVSTIESAGHVADSFVDYISNGYSFFKTGFTIFDKSVEGFESSSLHLVTAPLI